MKRKEFLNSACKFGLCGCFGISLLSGSELFSKSKISQDDNESDWRIDFMQNRFKSAFILSVGVHLIIGFSPHFLNSR